MLNRFAGYCSRCTWLVQPGGGEVERIDGKWVIRHDYCADSDRTAARYAALRAGEELESPCRPK